MDRLAQTSTDYAFDTAGAIVRVGNTDLTHILWPFSVMLTTWHSSGSGILITTAAVGFNCLMYIAIALLLRALVRLVSPRRPG